MARMDKVAEYQNSHEMRALGREQLGLFIRDAAGMCRAISGSSLDWGRLLCRRVCGIFWGIDPQSSS